MVLICDPQGPPSMTTCDEDRLFTWQQTQQSYFIQHMIYTLSFWEYKATLFFEANFD
jgi:hypothetical protein